MNASEKLIKIAENEQKIFESGKETEKRERWNKQLETLAATAYNYGFAGKGWNDETFTPYTDLKILAGKATPNMFLQSGFSDLKGVLERFGTTLDLSESTDITYLFSSSAVAYLPILVFNRAYNISYMFNKCTNLISVDKLVFSRPITNTTSTFLNCTSLEEIRISGEIKVSLDIHWSPLSKESVESIVASLSNSVSGQTVTFNKTKMEKIDDGSWWEGQYEKATAKGWNVSLMDI